LKVDWESRKIFPPLVGGNKRAGGIIKMLHPPFNFLPSREEKYNVDLSIKDLYEY
jgi:hypothetical protein